MYHRAFKHLLDLYPQGPGNTSFQLWWAEICLNIARHPLWANSLPGLGVGELLLQPCGTLHYQKASQPANVYWVLPCCAQDTVWEGTRPTWLDLYWGDRTSVQWRSERSQVLSNTCWGGHQAEGEYKDWSLKDVGLGHGRRWAGMLKACLGPRSRTECRWQSGAGRLGSEGQMAAHS